MQIICNDKTVRSNIVQEIKAFNSQSLATQAGKGEKWVSMRRVFKKAFGSMGENIVEKFTENESSENKIGSYDEKWLNEFEAKLLK